MDRWVGGVCVGGGGGAGAYLHRLQSRRNPVEQHCPTGCTPLGQLGWRERLLLHLHLVQTHEVLLVGGVQLGSVLALVGPVPRSGHRVVVVVLVRGKDNGAGPPVLHWECGAWVQQGAG